MKVTLKLLFRLFDFFSQKHDNLLFKKLELFLNRISLNNTINPIKYYIHCSFWKSKEVKNAFKIIRWELVKM